MDLLILSIESIHPCGDVASKRNQFIHYHLISGHCSKCRRLSMRLRLVWCNSRFWFIGRSRLTVDTMLVGSTSDMIYNESRLVDNLNINLAFAKIEGHFGLTF
ncbi:hypothetical protein Lal_00012731 [Lupinus albus]|nr:hypothetical protein Lal_00012731 [Lupinus albus]